MKVARSDGAAAAVAALADRIAELAESASGDFCIAFSGGESAKSLYPELARRRLDFSRFKIFFVDERCVFPDSPDSNYRWARELFLGPLKIRGGRVFRLRGEECPVDAAEAASKAAAENLPSAGGFPQFDCVVLGIGPDMHTASIFPDTMELLDSPKIYGVCHTKSSEFWRITLTGKAILKFSRPFWANPRRRFCRGSRRLSRRATFPLPPPPFSGGRKTARSLPDSDPPPRVSSCAGETEVFFARPSPRSR